MSRDSECEHCLRPMATARDRNAHTLPAGHHGICFAHYGDTDGCERPARFDITTAAIRALIERVAALTEVVEADNG